MPFGPLTGQSGGPWLVGACRKRAIIRPRESGETGRRAGLRIQWAKALGGSTPPSRTNRLTRLRSSFWDLGPAGSR